MPTPTFKRVSIELFEKMLDSFPFTRRINAVHMHHTWKPTRSDFNGHDTIVAMWRYHTQENKWRDIAQHITIDPQGFIWLGRNWNLPPASAAGHNGNADFGPFMFEMVGNFDKGRDPFDGPQRETALQVVALVQTRFGLAADTLLFHNAMSAKSCPGSSLDYSQILAEVESRKSAIATWAQASRQTRRSPFPDEPDLAVDEAIRAASRASFDGTEPADAELSHREHDSILHGELDHQLGRGAARDRGISMATLAAMRPHLINLSMGRFSNEGQVASGPADVDAIFEQHLPAALAQATAEGQRLKLMFYAHGGLVSESSGLLIAAKHIGWWKQNGVYPIYFIWETGFHETIASLLKRAEQGSARGLPRDLWDFTLDPLIEVTARALRGPGIWGGMKSSAEHAIDSPLSTHDTGGGALYVANKLKVFCDHNAGNIELHAVGHSAGAIFQSYFLSASHQSGVPTFASVQFLAPAVRVDTFMALLGSKIGDTGAARKLTIFTMKKDFEKADNCAGIYHKSLLYLISNALEDVRSTPILGLEESLRGNADLKALFGLAGTASTRGEVVWSRTAADTGASASTSLSHGGFDDDPPTMDSLARRILGKADADRIVGYAGTRDIMLAPRPWIDDVDLPAGIGVAPPTYIPPDGADGVPGRTAPHHGAAAEVPYTEFWSQRGNRRALCVGINRYPDPRHELAGCVADAQMWADTLRQLGFTANLLTDHHATREAIARELLALVNGSQSGDVIVFQYAGHGTMVPDINGDENDAQDEALCPVDFATGALYIDDDIAQVFAQLPDGVNLTCFMDCCHSGSNSRFAVGVPLAMPRPGQDERKRYIRATPELVDAHIRFRQKMGASRNAMGTGGRSLMRDIKFAACLDSEIAWESDGHGEFTLRTTRALAVGIQGLTNEQFVKQVTADFGARPRQHPMLDCSLEARARMLLQPVSGNGAAAWPADGATRAGVDTALIAQTLSSLQRLLTHSAQQ